MPISLEHTYYEGQTDALQGSGPIPPMGMGRDEYLAGYSDVLDRFAVAEVQHGGDPADAFVAYVQEEPDFSSVASVLQRVRSLEEWRDLFTARASNREASDGEITAYADLAELASEEIDVAKGALVAHEDKRAASFAGGIPGGVSISVPGGIGYDDGTFMFAEASEALDRYASIDWESFSTDHFAQWVSDQHPELLAHREVRAEVAAEYAQSVTAGIEDLGLRGELVSEFVAAAEDYDPEVPTSEEIEVPEDIPPPDELDLDKSASRHQAADCTADSDGNGPWDCDAGPGGTPCPECRRLQLDASDFYVDDPDRTVADDLRDEWREMAKDAKRTAAYGQPPPFDPDAAEQVSIYKSHSSPFPWLLVTAKGSLVRHTDLGKIGTIEDAIATANGLLGQELSWEITQSGGTQDSDSARFK